jgi:hypothetical protein
MTSELQLAKLLEIDDKLGELREERQTILKEIYQERKNNPLSVEQDDGTWVRFTVHDNAAKLAAEEFYWKPVMVERLSVKIDRLKNKPKEI